MIFYRCPKCGKIIALVDGSSPKGEMPLTNSSLLKLSRSNKKTIAPTFLTLTLNVKIDSKGISPNLHLFKSLCWIISKTGNEDTLTTENGS